MISEARPLAAFGPAVTMAASRELERVGVRVKTGVDADLQRGHRMTLRLRPSEGTLEVDRLVALPRLEGRRLDGVPGDDDGFIPVDDRSAVRELEGVWALPARVTAPCRLARLRVRPGRERFRRVVVAARRRGRRPA